MCDTIGELNRNTKARLEVLERGIFARFDSLEKSLIVHAETPPAALSPLLNEIRQDLKEVKEQTTKTNGRVSKLESWRDMMKGASIATKIFWSGMSVFVIASIVGVFQMYMEYDKIDYVIVDYIGEHVVSECLIK